jgi:hypothetical protein
MSVAIGLPPDIEARLLNLASSILTLDTSDFARFEVEAVHPLAVLT